MSFKGISERVKVVGVLVVLNRIESPLLYRVSICFNVVNLNGFLIWKRKVSNYMDKMMRLLLNEMHVFVKD